ncbi:MAG TPA: group I intron-associated PD-(D/E)XK endonuclease [Terriglobales bacterium]|nr:group I intron-associated PD-(D/E)XK endonuclease [Terriglobales bacterium]
MKKTEAVISDRKLRGEWAEMYFMTRAAEQGLTVNKPFGEMAHFDFVIGDHGCLLRVQVKSTLARSGSAYKCSVRGGHRPYVGDVFDFIAALVIPEDAWYIIPAKLIFGRGNISLRPASETSEFAPYKEAWHLLCTRPCSVRAVSHIEGCADPGVTSSDLEDDRVDLGAESPDPYPKVHALEMCKSQRLPGTARALNPSVNSR